MTLAEVVSAYQTSRDEAQCRADATAVFQARYGPTIRVWNISEQDGHTLFGIVCNVCGPYQECGHLPILRKEEPC